MVLESAWIMVEVTGILCDKIAEKEVHTEKQVCGKTAHVKYGHPTAVWVSWFWHCTVVTAL